MAQTPLFANIAELSELNVFTFISSHFTVVYVPFQSYCPQNKPAYLPLFYWRRVYLHVKQRQISNLINATKNASIRCTQKFDAAIIL